MAFGIFGDSPQVAAPPTNAWNGWDGNLQGNLSPGLMGSIDAPKTNLADIFMGPKNASVSPNGQFQLNRHINDNGITSYTLVDTTGKTGSMQSHFDANGVFDNRFDANKQNFGDFIPYILAAAATAGVASGAIGGAGATTAGAAGGGTAAGAGGAVTGLADGAALDAMYSGSAMGMGSGAGATAGGGSMASLFDSLGSGGGDPYSAMYDGSSTFGGGGYGNYDTMDAFYGGTDGGATLGGGGSFQGAGMDSVYTGSGGNGVTPPNPFAQGGGGQRNNGGLGGLFSGNNAGLAALLATLAPVLGGAIDATRQGSAADKMMQWMNTQQGQLNGLFDMNSPYYQQMWNEMSAKDAAAGRNSQYGTRATELAGRLAPLQATSTIGMTNALARPYAAALNQDASKYTGLLSAIGQAFRPFGQGGGGGTPANPYAQGGGDEDWGAILNLVGGLFT